MSLFGAWYISHRNSSGDKFFMPGILGRFLSGVKHESNYCPPLSERRSFFACTMRYYIETDKMIKTEFIQHKQTIATYFVILT